MAQESYLYTNMNHLKIGKKDVTIYVKNYTHTETHTLVYTHAEYH